MHFTSALYLNAILLFIVLHFMCINGRDLLVSGHPPRVTGRSVLFLKNSFFSHRSRLPAAIVPPAGLGRKVCESKKVQNNKKNRKANQKLPKCMPFWRSGAILDQHYSTSCYRCANGAIHPQVGCYFEATLQHFFARSKTVSVLEGRHSF